MAAALTRNDAAARGRPFAVLGLLLTLLLPALDGTVVGTAMPRLLADLHALDRYTWLTTAYLLTSTVSVPIAAKLTDLYGRRPFLLVGGIGFVVASLLCGLAQNLPQLIAGRALQGIGGGVVTAAVFAAVPSLFSPAARARIVGLFTGTYGLAALLGPLVGGLLTDFAGWRAVFTINLPVGLLALGLVWAMYPDTRSTGYAASRPRVDVRGAATLAGGLGLLVLALSLGGHDLPWTSPVLGGLVLLALASLALFVVAERRAAEPIIPLALLGSRGVGLATAGMLLMAMGLFGATLFTPLYLQGVLGRSAAFSGGLLTPLMLAFVAASVLCGQLIARGARSRLTALVGMLLAAAGLAGLARLGREPADAALVGALIVTGLGLGTALTSFALTALNAAPPDRTGVATGLTTTARAVGGALASAIFGAVLSAGLGTASGPAVMAAALQTTFGTASAVLLVGAGLALFLDDRLVKPGRRPGPGHVAQAPAGQL
ncbi:MAG TPA: MFS transporter [Chloroflexota bacterium]|nr:MFS transporter [Chloroflexota bacterium]